MNSKIYPLVVRVYVVRMKTSMQANTYVATYVYGIIIKYGNMYLLNSSNIDMKICGF